MKQTYLTFLFCVLSLWASGSGSFQVIADQAREGNEVVIDITIKGEGSTSFPLGASDFPIHIDPTILDVGAARLDPSNPSQFDQSHDASSYKPLSLVYANGIMAVRVNEKGFQVGSGTDVNSTEKTVARIRIPIIDMCGNNVLSWEKQWGQMIEFSSDDRPEYIKANANFIVRTRDLSLSQAPDSDPKLVPVSQNVLCAGQTETLAIANPEDYQIAWYRNGAMVQLGRDAKFIIKESGEYYATYKSCSFETYSDTVSFTFLTEPDQPFISENQGVLTSSVSVGIQWFLNGQPILGATGQNYIPTQSGSYTVEVGNDCFKKLSDPYVYSITALGQGVIASRAEVYPNPFQTKTGIFLDLVKDSEVRIEVYDLKGVMVQEIAEQMLNVGSYEWTFRTGDLNLASGAYVLKMYADGRIYTTTLLEIGK